MQNLIFKIKCDGTVTCDAQGFVGEICNAATAPFEELFGEIEKELKSEYYEVPQTEDQVVGIKNGSK